MIPATFDYARPKNLDEVFALLAEHGGEGKILAGGHSLLPMMKLRMATPTMLIDISRISGLDGIKASGNSVTIGALATHAAIAANGDVRRVAPALADAAGDIGDQQVRNRGTIGGACAHADPAADYPAVLVALGARFTIGRKGGDTVVEADDFFRGLFETALGHADILTEIAIDAAPQSAYVKFPHPASHYAVVGVAANVRMSGGKIAEAQIAITGAGDCVFRPQKVERALVGVDPKDATALKAACLDAAMGSEARADVFASAQYRAAMAEVYCARAIKAAAART